MAWRGFLWLGLAWVGRGRSIHAPVLINEDGDITGMAGRGSYCYGKAVWVWVL